MILPWRGVLVALALASIDLYTWSRLTGLGHFSLGYPSCGTRRACGWSVHTPHHSGLELSVVGATGPLALCTCPRGLSCYGKRLNTMSRKLPLVWRRVCRDLYGPQRISIEPVLGHFSADHQVEWTDDGCAIESFLHRPPSPSLSAIWIGRPGRQMSITTHLCTPSLLYNFDRFEEL